MENAPYRFLARAVAFGAFFLLLSQGWRAVGYAYPNVEIPTREGDTLYVAYDSYFYDHVRYMFEEGGPRKVAAKADLLFLGNSRLMLGLDADAVRAACSPLGIAMHVFGFGWGERFKLPFELMQREDMRPKLVVMNVEGEFFQDRYSDYAQSLVKLGEKGAMAQAARRGEANAFFRRWMSVVSIPQLHFADSRVSSGRWWDEQWPWVKLEPTRLALIWRSETFGDWKVVGKEIAYKEHAPVGKPAPMAALPDEAEQLANARRFVTWLRDRGTEVVFITVPNFDHDESHSLRVAKELGVTAIVVPWEGLYSFDVSHLDEESATKFTKAILPRLKESPEWKRAFPGREAP